VATSSVTARTIGTPVPFVFACLYRIAPDVLNTLLVVKPERSSVGIALGFACCGGSALWPVADPPPPLLPLPPLDFFRHYWQCTGGDFSDFAVWDAAAATLYVARCGQTVKSNDHAVTPLPRHSSAPEDCVSSRRR
jgi:hypothetical protein